MGKIKLKLAVSLMTGLLFFACSEDKYQGDYDYLNSDTKVSVTFDEEAFVSLEFATNVAEVFLSKDAKNGAKSFANASVETIRDKSNNPSMYVINYPEGGWVIIGATRNYYPVLAYNDEGYFEIRPETEMGGAFLWLEETKEAVRVSAALADTTKAQMRGLWNAYETNDKKISEKSGTKNYQIMYDRMDQLYVQYGQSGWFPYYTLEQLQGLFQPSQYQYMESLSYMFGSSPEFTIVALKEEYTTPVQVGPLLTTKWHQDAPFNNNIAPNKAGCVAVAIAQIMKYHEYSGNWGFSFDWNKMPNTAAEHNLTPLNAYYDTPAFIHSVGQAAGTSYGHQASSSDHDRANSVFKNNHFYIVGNNPESHNVATVRSNILSKRPVYMGGQIGTNSWDPGHAWVCDGVKDNKHDTWYFVEFFNGSSYSNYGFILPTNPGHCGGYTYTYYHMNWGESTISNGWVQNNVFPYNVGNFKDQRKNIYPKCGNNGCIH